MRAEIELITPEIAKDYLSRNFQNRQLRQKIVDYYAKQMKENLWQITGQGISFDSSNKLIDGQHRLAAIIKSNMPINILVIRGVQSSSFEFYDLGKNRTSADILSIENVEYFSLISSSIGTYFALQRKLKMNGNNARVKDSNITPHDVKNEYYKNKKLWDIIAPFVQNKLYSKLKLMSPTRICGFMAYVIIDKGYSLDFVSDYLLQLFGEKEDKYNCTISFRKTIINDRLSFKKIQTNDLFSVLFYNFIAYINKRDRFSFLNLDLSIRPDFDNLIK